MNCVVGILDLVQLRANKKSHWGVTRLLEPGTLARRELYPSHIVELLHFRHFPGPLPMVFSLVTCLSSKPILKAFHCEYEVLSYFLFLYRYFYFIEGVLVFKKDLNAPNTKSFHVPNPEVIRALSSRGYVKTQFFVAMVLYA